MVNATLGPMGKLLLDTRDDRREIWHLLSLLHPIARVEFLKWCCRLAWKGPHQPIPNPLTMRQMVADAQRCDRGDQRLTSEVYRDFWTLVLDYQLDEQLCAVELQRRVKSKFGE